jgi:hypothetical protein
MIDAADARIRSDQLICQFGDRFHAGKYPLKAIKRKHGKGVNRCIVNRQIVMPGNDSRFAEAYAADVPGFNDLFPRPTYLNPGAVLRTANVYLAALVPTATDDAATVAAKAARVQVFVDHAQPATLAADLQAQVQAIGTVAGTHEESREAGVLSTAQIASLVQEGQKQRNLLNAIFQSVYANIPDKLAAWNSASHVEHASHHAAATPTSTGTTAMKAATTK